jgi:phenylacetic acid degradation operon negative regulatory protein
VTSVNQEPLRFHDLELDLLVPSSKQNSLLTDIASLYVRQLGGWLPSLSWVRLLGLLGVPEQTARSGLHRMERGGYLVREPRTRVAGYAISASWQSVFQHTEAEVEHLLRDQVVDAGGEWTFVSFSLPENRRAERHALRSTLVKNGFGTVASGLWLAPGDLSELILALVEQMGLTSQVNVFTGRNHGPESDADLARRCWDLESIGDAYRGFVRQHKAALRRTERGQLEQETAFVDLTLAHNAWRSLVRTDPGLPSAVLGNGWPGHEAARIMGSLVEALRPTATKFVRGTLPGQGPEPIESAR